MTTLEMLRAVCPESVNMADATCNLALAWAADSNSVTYWGDKLYQRACVLYAAHNLVRNAIGGSGVAGPVISQRVGDWQNSFGWITQRTDGLNATTYGQQFIALMRERPPAATWAPNRPGS